MKGIMYLVVLIMLSAIAFAIPFNSPYLEDNKVILNGTFDFELNLQNPSNEEVTAVVTVINGTELTNFGEQDFVLEPNTNENKVVITLKEPTGAKLGDTYLFVYSIGSKQGDAGDGMVGVSSAVKKTVDVQIGIKPANYFLLFLFGFVVLVILIGVLWYYAKK